MRKAFARKLPLPLVLVAAGALATPASAATITSGQLDWTQANVFTLVAPGLDEQDLARLRHRPAPAGQRRGDAERRRHRRSRHY